MQFKQLGLLGYGEVGKIFSAGLKPQVETVIARDLKLAQGHPLQTAEATPMSMATCMYYTGIDPFTKKPEWGMRSTQDDPKSTAWGGQNVFAVYSKTMEKAADGTPYSEW